MHMSSTHTHKHMPLLRQPAASILWVPKLTRQMIRVLHGVTLSRKISGPPAPESTNNNINNKKAAHFLRVIPTSRFRVSSLLFWFTSDGGRSCAASKCRRMTILTKGLRDELSASQLATRATWKDRRRKTALRAKQQGSGQGCGRRSHGRKKDRSN